MNDVVTITKNLLCSLLDSLFFWTIGMALYCVMLAGCTSEPPSNRPVVTLPPYTAGDSVRGEALYEENCSQCHKQQPGKNKKGPQLLGIYGAPAASLEDYKYSDEMASSGWVWSADQLDIYIEDPIAVMPDTRMLSDPIPNAQDRQDIIAYLSTLGRGSSVTSDTGL